MDIQYLVVHCSATTQNRNIGVKEIDRWHRAKGWLGVGYHYVIRRDGTVELGRPAIRPGAHCLGYNDVSLGICLVGGVSTRKRPLNNFTPEQMAALRSLLADLAREHPGVEVVGHRDLNPLKACPSFDVRAWWSEQMD